MMGRVIIFDSETTGLVAGENGVIGVSLLVVDFNPQEAPTPFSVVAVGRWLANPGDVPFPESAQKINGFTPEIISRFPPKQLVIPEFRRFAMRYDVAQVAWAAHRAVFDVGMLVADGYIPAEFERTHRVICTKEMAYRWRDEEGGTHDSNRLQDLTDHYGMRRPSEELAQALDRLSDSRVNKAEDAWVNGIHLSGNGWPGAVLLTMATAAHDALYDCVCLAHVIAAKIGWRTE